MNLKLKNKTLIDMLSKLISFSIQWDIYSAI